MAAYTFLLRNPAGSPGLKTIDAELPFESNARRKARKLATVHQCPVCLATAFGGPGQPSFPEAYIGTATPNGEGVFGATFSAERHADA